MSRQTKAAAARAVVSADAAWNAQIEAEHAKMRAEILSLRPSWDADALAAIKRSYGDGTPEGAGLWNILGTLRAADALEARFGSKR